MYFEEPQLCTDSNPGVYTKPCTQMFMAALFIIAKLGGNQDALQ